MRIDILLFKSLEFKNVVGQKVKIIDIPVMDKKHRYYFLIQFRLQTLMNILYKDIKGRKCCSFKDYLKRVVKWPIYEEIFKVPELKNNA